MVDMAKRTLLQIHTQKSELNNIHITHTTVAYCAQHCTQSLYKYYY